jgi:ankyrin repeat protein
MIRIKLALSSLLFAFPILSFADSNVPLLEKGVASCTDTIDPPEQCPKKVFIWPEYEVAEEKKATTLLEAICMESPTQVKELILAGHDVNQCDRFGLSMLHMAAAIGNPETIKILLDAGVSVNLQCGSEKSTPSHSAVRFNQLAALQALVEHQADLTILDAKGRTLKDIAQTYEFEEISSYLQSLNSPTK